MVRPSFLILLLLASMLMLWPERDSEACASCHIDLNHGGAGGQEFPWSNDWKPGLSNTGAEEWDYHVAPVESYQSDKSPFGIYDLAGNVSEWVADWYEPYQGSDYKSADFGHLYKVVRGAGWSGGEGQYALQLFQRGAYRGNLPPDKTFDDVGFRCAADGNVKGRARQTATTSH